MKCYGDRVTSYDFTHLANEALTYLPIAQNFSARTTTGLKRLLLYLDPFYFSYLLIFSQHSCFGTITQHNKILYIGVKFNSISNLLIIAIHFQDWWFRCLLQRSTNARRSTMSDSVVFLRRLTPKVPGPRYSAYTILELALYFVKCCFLKMQWPT